MRKEMNSKGKSRKKSRMGILIGIPLLLFICGIALLSIGTYNYMKYAFYLSRIFIQDEAKPQIKTQLISEEKKIKFPTLGDEFGSLVIESAKIDVPVIHGDREEDLLKAVGHYNGSRFPGEGGNIVLAGHRNSVFKSMKDVKKGDKIILNTTYGKYFYEVSEFKIIKGNDNSIVQPTDTEKLTLYTCYPFDYIGNAPNRYVVISDLVEGAPLKELLLKEGGNK